MCPVFIKWINKDDETLDSESFKFVEMGFGESIFRYIRPEFRSEDKVVGKRIGVTVTEEGHTTPEAHWDTGRYVCRGPSTSLVPGTGLSDFTEISTQDVSYGSVQ